MYEHTWPLITGETEEAVLACLRRGEISNYKRQGVFAEFEDAFGAFHGRPHTLVMSSGTAAGHAALVACELRPGDEVIAPVYTFYASISPIFQTGATPVLVEAGADGNIDPKAIEAAITPRTKAIVVTHMWGMPCDMGAIVKICRKYGLRLIEDCSHAHGALYKGRLVGTFGDVAFWSLQGQKLVTGGEGGVFATNIADMYYRALLFGQYNKRCLQEIPKDHPLYRYAVTGMGLKLRAHPFAIAMALQQFEQLPGWHAVMNRNAARLTERLERIEGIALPRPKYAGDEPSWYAYTFTVQQPLTISTKQFCEELNKAGLADADMPGSTCPLNLLPLFQDPAPLFPSYEGLVSYRRGDFPVAEHFFNSAIKVPIGVSEDREYIGVLDEYAQIIGTTLRKFAA